MKVKINKLDSNACGVAKLGDRVILVEKTLPNEEIKILEKESKNKYDIAKEYEILNKHQDRVSAPCQYYNKCGGCSLQHANNCFEKNFKINKVKDSLHYVANLDIEINNFIQGQNLYGYRNKIVFAVHNYRCGMYQNLSNNFVEVGNCLLISDELNIVYKDVANWIYDNKIQLNHIALRQIGELFSIILIGTVKPDISSLINILDKKMPNKYQIAYNKNDARKDLITSNIIILKGIDVIDECFGIKYVVSPNSFLQVNKEVSIKLYNKVSQCVDGNVVINAYSGAGLLSAILSKTSKKVYGIEIVKNAHINAEELKKRNNINNVINICGKSEEKIPTILRENKKITIVLDPPRKGVDVGLLDLINKSENVDKIIYISCSPNSLAKDIRHLENYDIKDVELFDMFPQTHHVETLVVLERKV